MLSNFLDLAPVGIPGPDHGIVAIANELNGGLDLVTQVDAQPMIERALNDFPSGTTSPFIV